MAARPNGGRAASGLRASAMWPTGSASTSATGRRAWIASMTTSGSCRRRSRTMTMELTDRTRHEGAGTMAVQQLGNERTTAYADGQELVFEKIFDAPRERVTNWWGPRGYTTTVEEMDVRVGGRWRWVNHTTGGEDVAFKGEYLEVVPP